MMQTEKNLPEGQANPFEEGAARAPQDERVTLVVDGEEIRLTMDELVQAAVSGLSRRAEVIRMAGAAGQVPSGQIYANFVAAYPEVQPGDIPPEVWEDAQMEGNLVSAYRKHEIAALKARLAALEQNERNRTQTVGPAVGDGQPAQIDPIIYALRGE